MDVLSRTCWNHDRADKLCASPKISSVEELEILAQSQGHDTTDPLGEGCVKRRNLVTENTISP